MQKIIYVKPEDFQMFEEVKKYGSVSAFVAEAVKEKLKRIENENGKYAGNSVK